jgi:hypothetical protein
LNGLSEQGTTQEEKGKELNYIGGVSRSVNSFMAQIRTYSGMRRCGFLFLDDGGGGFFGGCGACRACKANRSFRRWLGFDLDRC